MTSILAAMNNPAHLMARRIPWNILITTRLTSTTINRQFPADRLLSCLPGCQNAALLCKSSQYGVPFHIQKSSILLVDSSQFRRSDRFLSMKSNFKGNESLTEEPAKLPPNVEVSSLWQKCRRDIDPYKRLIRFDRPIGSWLLFWPCGWSIALAANPGCWPDPLMLGVFATGAFVMRGAGCTINDMWDRKIDAQVERTKERPLASGQLSQFDALVFLAAQLGIGLQVNLHDLCYIRA